MYLKNFNKKRINKNKQKSQIRTLQDGMMSEQVNQLCRFLEVFKDWINVIKSFYNLTSLFCTCDILRVSWKVTVLISFGSDSPVRTTLPDTNMRSTIFGLTIRYIKPGNSSGS